MSTFNRNRKRTSTFRNPTIESLATREMFAADLLGAAEIIESNTSVDESLKASEIQSVETQDETISIGEVITDKVDSASSNLRRRVGKQLDKASPKIAESVSSQQDTARALRRSLSRAGSLGDSEIAEIESNAKAISENLGDLLTSSEFSKTPEEVESTLDEAASLLVEPELGSEVDPEESELTDHEYGYHHWQWQTSDDESSEKQTWRWTSPRAENFEQESVVQISP